MHDHGKSFVKVVHKMLAGKGDFLPTSGTVVSHHQKTLLRGAGKVWFTQKFCAENC